jgi:transcriptional regulator with XRE-family HTH domain
MNDKSHINWYGMSDASLMESIGAFIKQQRMQRNLSQEKVANAANISRSTLSLLERGETVTLASLIQVLRTLELLHIMDGFQIQEQMSPIAIAKMQQKKRKRASGKNNDEAPKTDW